MWMVFVDLVVEVTGTNQFICGLSSTLVKQLDVGDTFVAGRILPKHQQDDEKDHGSCYWMVSLDLRDDFWQNSRRSKQVIGPKDWDPSPSN
jgi:hypothetical protein